MLQEDWEPTFSTPACKLYKGKAKDDVKSKEKASARASTRTASRTAMVTEEDAADQASHEVRFPLCGLRRAC